MVVVVAPRLLLLSLLLYCLLGYVGGDAIDEVPSSSIRIRASSPTSTVSEGVESETYCRYDALLVRWEWRRGRSEAAAASQVELSAALIEENGSTTPERTHLESALHRWSGRAELGLRRFGAERGSRAAAAAAEAAGARAERALAARVGSRSDTQQRDRDAQDLARRKRRQRRQRRRRAAATSIECEVGGPACVPAVVTVAWNEHASRIEVNFDQATNAPSFSAHAHGSDDEDDDEDEDGEGEGDNMASRLASVLVLRPMPSVLAAAPHWLEGARTLVVPVDLPRDRSAVAADFSSGNATATLVDRRGRGRGSAGQGDQDDEDDEDEDDDDDDEWNGEAAQQDGEREDGEGWAGVGDPERLRFLPDEESGLAAAGAAVRGLFPFRLGELPPDRSFRVALVATTRSRSDAAVPSEQEPPGAVDDDDEAVVALSRPFRIVACHGAMYEDEDEDENEDGGGGSTEVEYYDQDVPVEEVVLHSLPVRERSPAAFTLDAPADSPALDPLPSGDEAALSLAPNRPPNRPPPPPLPLPFWDPRGVWALTGDRPLVLPSSSLPGGCGGASGGLGDGLGGGVGDGSCVGPVGDWSISFWVYVVEPPTGNFRTLLFKGHTVAGGGERTPSVWLLPGSMRLAMRASMGAEHSDIGGESVSALPLKQWAHVAFTFKNHSRPGDANGANDANDANDAGGGGGGLVGNAQGHHFAFSFFLDGFHDVTASFPAPVQANDADLRLAKDPSHGGPKGLLLAHPKLWLGALGWNDVRQEHVRGRSAFFADGSTSGGGGAGGGAEEEEEEDHLGGSSDDARGECGGGNGGALSIASVLAVTSAARASTDYPFFSRTVVSPLEPSWQEGSRLRRGVRSLGAIPWSSSASSPPSSSSSSSLSGSPLFRGSPALARRGGFVPKHDMEHEGTASPRECSGASNNAAGCDYADAENDDDEEEEDELEDEDEEDEEERRRNLAAAQVHWLAGLAAACDGPDARLEAFEAAAALGHARAAAAAGNLLLFGEERFKDSPFTVGGGGGVEVRPGELEEAATAGGAAGGAAVAAAGVCPTGGDGGGERRATVAGTAEDNARSRPGALAAVASAVLSSAAPVKRTGEGEGDGGGYGGDGNSKNGAAADDSESGSGYSRFAPSSELGGRSLSLRTARGLFYLQAAAAAGDAAAARTFAFLSLSGVGAGAFADDAAAAAEAAAAVAAGPGAGAMVAPRQQQRRRRSSRDSSGAAAAAATGGRYSLELLDVSKCAPATGAAAFDRSRCSLKRRGALMAPLSSSSSSSSSSSPSSPSSSSALVARAPRDDQRGRRSGRWEWREGRRTVTITMSYGDESSPSSSPSLRTTRPPRLRTRTKTVSSVAVPSVTEVGLGMLHAAAALGDAEAALALAHRYEKGLGVEASPDVAAFYYLGAAGESHSQFHRSGRQPSWEMNRLRDGEEEAEVAGQTGDEDERLRKLVAQAEEDGLVPSMVQLAGLLYWGHRGFARDQPRARGLWDAVAERGFLAAAGGGDGGDPFPFETTNAEVAAAGMFLKGEGGDANHTRAVELYERAAAKGNVAALNGLGYAYFFGNHLPQDLPRAFGYFREASASEAAEGDSLFNAAHCLANGLGTERDEGAAVALYDAAAVRFGHFDSIHEMATRHMLGRVPRPSPSSSPNPNASGGDGHPLYQPRNVNQALRYLSPVARGGDWGGRVRSGFDAFLDVGKARRKLGVSGLHMLPSAISSPSSSDSSFSSSSSSSSSSSFSSALSSSGQVNSARPLLLYAEAAQMGFEIAQSNAAYLLDKRVVSPHDARALLLLEPPPHPPRLSPLPSLPPPKQAQGYIAAGQGDDAAAPLAEDFDALPSGGGSPAASSVASSGAPPQSVSSSSSLSSSFLSSSSSSSSSSFADDAGAVSKLWSLHFHAAAAAQENHESFVAIGDAHFYGYGVDLARGGGGGSRRQIQQQEQKPDYEGALWWYSKAAQAGVPRGAYNLGYMYERGLGAPASEVRAERHYRRAAELLAARAAERRERNRRGGSFGLDGGGHGYGESILGDELHAKAVLWVSLAGLRLRRTAREWGFEWAASSFLDY